MKPKLFIFNLVVGLTFFPTVFALGQNTNIDRENALALEIRESRKNIDTFQAFGVRTQEGPLFDPGAIKQGEATSWSKQKFVYLSFQGINGRISERKFDAEVLNKSDRLTPEFYASTSTDSIFYGDAGFHLVTIMPGGRYVNEDVATSIAFPVQTIGFWVSEEKKWPDELLESGRYQVVGKRRSAEYSTVIDIKGATVDNHPTRFTVAPEFGYRVIEAETQDENSVYRSELKSLIKINGTWCPKRFTRTVQSLKGYSPSIQDYYLDKIIVNKAVKSDILFNAVAGDHNENFRSKNSSYTLPDGSRKYVTLSNDNQSLFSLVKGWLYIASVTTLLVLTVGAFIKWKRKQLSKQG